MANDTDQSTALAPVQQSARPVKVYEPVTDVVPILDTARFEHMQRIATIMAGSSLIPDSLRLAGTGNDKFELPPATVVANCFLIVNQAVRWGMDPFAVAGSTSVVHGRLMYEGKLVAAVLESKLGLQLKYEFGTWIPETESVDLSKEGKGDLLGVRVSAQRVGDSEPVFIEGAVGIWKTAGNNSPWKPGALKRQCRYRGAREWSRAYNAGLMLGVITDDELDVLADRRETAQRLAPPKAGESAGRRPLQAGFGDESDQILKKATPTPEAPKTDNPPVESTKGDPAPAETKSEPIKAGTTDTEISHDDHLIAMFDLGREAAGIGEAREAPEDLDDEEAEHWLDGWDKRAEELAAEDNAGETVAEAEKAKEPTVAPMGEVYMIVGEEFSAAGRRKAYKDGFSHSGVGAKGAAELKEYDLHPPIMDDKEGKKPDEEASSEAQAGEPEGSSTGSDAATSEADEEIFPGDVKTTPKPEGEPNIFADAHAKIIAAALWVEIKQHLRDISVTDAYKGAEDEGKRMLRLWAFDAYKDLREGGKDQTEITADMTLFRFWLEFDAESPDQINSLFRQLHKAQAYTDASDNEKRALGEMITRRKEALAEGTK